ncbi:MAG TPA: winged helix-turn-helix domain-containing protein [Blastocatellia bacterium]|nr:winged helix-turn-helix domain-containing protein [Blastocatellia bacterium]
MAISNQKQQVYGFDEFRLDVGERRLLREGRPIALPSKAFDLLLALIENRGRLVEKGELYSRVWADQIVEESNLTVQMSAIRKALGERRNNPRYIATVAGHGYRFIGDVAILDEEIEVKTTSRNAIEPETDPGYVMQEEFEVEPDHGVSNAVPALKTEAEDLATIPPRPLDIIIKEKASAPNRHRKALALALSALALAPLIVVVWLLLSRTLNRRAPLDKQMTMRRFATHGGTPNRVAISPDGKSLVYSQRFNGKDSLWLGQIETNSSVPIYQNTNLSYGEPVFSPDGGSIYVTVSDEKQTSWRLVRMPLLGGVMTELVSNVRSAITFSPNGKQFAFLRGDAQTNQTSIIVADAADVKNERVLAARKPPESFSSEGLSWAPDGKTVAVAMQNADGNMGIWAIGVADGRGAKIGDRDWGRVGNLAWLPDGSGLVTLARETAASRSAQIWFVPYLNGEARAITNDLNRYLVTSLSLSADGKLAVLQGFIHSSIWIAPDGDVKRARRVLQGVAPRYEGVDGLAWMPDGRLAYTAYVGDSLALWSLNPDDGNIRQLTSNNVDSIDSEVSVTADGRFLVFQSNRSGANEIWRANVDGGDLKQLTSTGHNSQPSLSPDGRWIVFTSVRGDKSSLQRISIDGGQTKQITDRPASYPQVSPDGRYIAYAETSTTQVRLVIIPFDGGTPIRSFAVPEFALRGRRRLRWTPDGKAIIYTGRQTLWRQALNEEKPQAVKGFEGLEARHLAWSFNGKDLAYTNGPSTQEIILIENLALFQK